MVTPLRLAVLVMLVGGCSCTTSLSSRGAKTAAADRQASAASTDARVQIEWQQRFQREIELAGNGAEGWALFADSSMGHTGQQLVVQKPQGDLTLCYAKAGEQDCETKPLAATTWTPRLPALKEADALKDRPLQSFDGITLEYVHLKNEANSARTIARVYFMLDHRALPKAYDELMDAFITLNK